MDWSLFLDLHICECDLLRKRDTNECGDDDVCVPVFHDADVSIFFSFAVVVVSFVSFGILSGAANSAGAAAASEAAAAGSISSRAGSAEANGIPAAAAAETVVILIPA